MKVRVFQGSVNIVNNYIPFFLIKRKWSKALETKKCVHCLHSLELLIRFLFLTPISYIYIYIYIYIYTYINIYVYLYTHTKKYMYIQEIKDVLIWYRIRITNVLHTHTHTHTHARTLARTHARARTQEHTYMYICI